MIAVVLVGGAVPGCDRDGQDRDSDGESEVCESACHAVEDLVEDLRPDESEVVGDPGEILGVGPGTKVRFVDYEEEDLRCDAFGARVHRIAFEDAHGRTGEVDVLWFGRSSEYTPAISFRFDGRAILEVPSVSTRRVLEEGADAYDGVWVTEDPEVYRHALYVATVFDAAVRASVDLDLSIEPQQQTSVLCDGVCGGMGHAATGVVTVAVLAACNAITKGSASGFCAATAGVLGSSAGSIVKKACEKAWTPS
ncbi:MAG: hypothetical protein D6705_02440 [Deltaproteobacteria bacterium]|nr:MAG: hypothetical protein D6705_02440 [Deltaproteobacteria bacterium]